jgi:hypothetical protein
MQTPPKPQPSKINNSEILLERDYTIQIYDGQKQLIPVGVSFIHNFTISFDIKNITLSIYLTEVTDPISIKELQQAKTIYITYHSKTLQEPIIQQFEVIDIVGSTQGNISSEKPLSYVVQFILK